MQAPDLNAPDDGDCELDALMQDKLETHCRQQLSALVDGALPPDEARFLLRRLQHDGALAGRWERWQVYGECMRGGVSQLLPADFSQRVCAALEAEAARALPVAAVRGARPTWTRWAGGAALAASVAMAAFVVVQRDPQASPSESVQVASSVPGPDAGASSEGAAGDVPAPTAGETALQSGATAGALLLAARELPRRTATRTTAAVRPAQSAAVQRPVETLLPAYPQEAAVQTVAVTAEGVGASPQAGRDPFGMDMPADPRRWPRAVLPGVGQGSFSVGYGGTSAEAGGFEYFEPQLPAEDSQASGAPAPDADR
jgi:negative regulator of sigma E activity